MAQVDFRIDRVQLAVPDRQGAAAGWTTILGAEPDGEDRIDALGALRTTLRLGDGFVELLEPDGSGPLNDAVARRGGHLFGAGLACHDPLELFEGLQRAGIDARIDAGQIHLSPDATGVPGLRLVISQERPAEPVGRIDFLYEVTLLSNEAGAASAKLASLLSLDSEMFVPIESDRFGYAGTLTLFAADALHRVEVITPNEPSKTMARFFERWGPTYYMAFAESSDLAAVEVAAEAFGASTTPIEARGQEKRVLDTLFLHPPALGGMMLGLSRPTLAWRWSGRPEQVTAP